MHHVKHKQNSRFTTRKRGLSRYHDKYHFHPITPIILLFHKSRPEKRTSHAIRRTTGGPSLTLVTNLSYRVFLTTSLSTTLLSLLKSGGTVFSLSMSILSTSAFKLSKSDFAAELDVSTSIAPF